MDALRCVEIAPHPNGGSWVRILRFRKLSGSPRTDNSYGMIGLSWSTVVRLERILERLRDDVGSTVVPSIDSKGVSVQVSTTYKLD